MAGAAQVHAGLTHPHLHRQFDEHGAERVIWSSSNSQQTRDVILLIEGTSQARGVTAFLEKQSYAQFGCYLFIITNFINIIQHQI